jgi:hypothetical protein
MSEVFVVRNQLGQYWGKKKRWVDGTKPRTVAFFKHEDEGLNQLVELSSKDIELRGEVAGAALDERGVPVVEPSEHLFPDEEDLLSEPGLGEAGAGEETVNTEADSEADAETLPDKETPAGP